MRLTERHRLLPLSMLSKSPWPLWRRRGFCQRPRPNKYSGRQSRPSRPAALAIKPPNCSPSLWKRFPSLSRHLGSKAIEEDRSYGHYTIFGTRPDIAALRLLSVQLLANLIYRRPDASEELSRGKCAVVSRDLPSPGAREHLSRKPTRARLACPRKVHHQLPVRQQLCS